MKGIRRIIAAILACSLLLTACASSNSNSAISVPDETSKTDFDTAKANLDQGTTLSDDDIEISNDDALIIVDDETKVNEEVEERSNDNEESVEAISEEVPDFYGLNDPDLLQYVEDTVYAGLVDEFSSEDYIIEDVNAIYYSKDYLEELAYNSKVNIFFGYTLAELDEQFQGEKYVFTLGDDGTTIVKPFEDYDDTYDKVIRNVAIGGGVILVCVTVSVVTGGLGAGPVSMIFAASAKTGTIMALSSGAFSSVAAGTITAIQTHDKDKAIKAAALQGSEAFMWGAIAGAAIGGISEANKLAKTAKAIDEMLANPGIPEWRKAELRALKKFGGEEQISFLAGKQVPYNTPGATRPDILRKVGNHYEAVEVKYFNLDSPQSCNTLYRELEREVAARVKDLPANSTQRVVLDVTNRYFSPETIANVTETIQSKLLSIYGSKIPVEIVGL